MSKNTHNKDSVNWRSKIHARKETNINIKKVDNRHHFVNREKRYTYFSISFIPPYAALVLTLIIFSRNNVGSFDCRFLATF
jgi:hypothetical protein